MDTGEPLALSLSAAGASVLPRLLGGCAGAAAAAPRLPAASSPVELRPRFRVSTLASSRAASRELRFVCACGSGALLPPMMRRFGVLGSWAAAAAETAAVTGSAVSP